MGVCIGRTEEEQDDGDLLLTTAPLIQDTGRSGPQDGPRLAGPFRLQVRFKRQGFQDLEGQAISALLRLVTSRDSRRSSTDNGSRPVAASKCIELLLAMQAGHNEELLDLVVPATTVMLHAPDKAVRRELWQFFVLVVVRADSLLAHLFYWALRCVAQCEQAAPGTKREAKNYMEQIAAELARRTEGTPNGTKISPLIDLFDQLHQTGDDLVKEQERSARQKLLESLLEKINAKLSHATTRVPLLLMVPDKSARRPGCMPASTLLRLPPTEAGVLSSKARAPYHVLVEADTRPVARKAKRDDASRFGFFCCRRARKNVSNGVKLSHAETNIVSKKRDQIPGLHGENTFEEVAARVRASSPFGSNPDWGLVSLIVKSSADDVRQEEMAYRLLKWFDRVFARDGTRGLWMRPFLIVATRHDAGCLEAVPNAISLDGLKKIYDKDPKKNWKSLRAYFEERFPVSAREAAAQGTVTFNQALANFVASMAAYSIICYVLCIRDRHNGNIMLDDVGHIIHVDFGFILCAAPGGRVLQQLGGFEPSTAFKLTSEFLELMDADSACDADKAAGRWHKEFRRAVKDGLVAVRTAAEELLALMQLSMLGVENNHMACFNSPRGYPEAVLEDICDRLCLPRTGGRTEVMSNDDFRLFVDRLIDGSVDHWRSRLYDQVQYLQNGIK